MGGGFPEHGRWQPGGYGPGWLRDEAPNHISGSIEPNLPRPAGKQPEMSMGVTPG